jgi:error-prone DNA polymerase
VNLSHLPPYAELHCVSNFSFLRGASHPEELVARAQELNYAGLAITDECSLAGVVRAHTGLKACPQERPLALMIGAEFILPNSLPTQEPDRVVLLAQTRHGYGNLSSLITRARRRADKGYYQLEQDDMLINGAHEGAALADCVALLVPCAHASAEHIRQRARWMRTHFEQRAWLAAELLMHGQDQSLLEKLKKVSLYSGLPLVAAGNVHFHLRSRKTMQDTLTAIRLGKPVQELGFAAQANAEQHLRSRLRLARLYPAALLEETLEVAAQCHFSLDELRYEYPEEIVPPGLTPTSYLRQLTEEGAKRRFPEGVPVSVRQQIEHELTLIHELHYEPYFLTVADLVQFARNQGILCQGRGSAANSAVCYCCGITEVDPARTSVLFERFISKERNEPPDIDVDFEHQRREEVIQYIYRKYGRHRAALTATVVSYRPKSALRDVGKALGIDLQRIEQLAKNHAWWDGKQARIERITEAGFDADSPVIQHWVMLTNQLIGFPRHLSQHTGGFVIARDDLTRLVPVENATMAERSVIQWDKDDLDALGLLKVDVLALGMLSAIRRALELIGQRYDLRDVSGEPRALLMQEIPPEDAATYEMICRADTVGVFQIESRAQMSMLPRLQPRRFYDLVIEVAIVRPGPIQGGMVHPYLRRRQGLEAVDYPQEAIKPALERTLGVPIFQEQVMQIAILAAGFTPGEADQLRRAMAAWKRKGGLGKFYDRVINGMLERGYTREFADSIFRQMEGFGEYGFPESHAASFALLVYVSCWIKCHEPAAFLTALLNSQPMGFYAPAQLVRDAREHGVEVLEVDVLVSQTECTLVFQKQASHEHDAQSSSPGADTGGPAVRLGLNRIHGLSEVAKQRILRAREESLFSSVADLAERAQLTQHDLHALSEANALKSLAGHRHNAHWQSAALKPLPPLLQSSRNAETPLTEQELPAPSLAQDVLADYNAIGVPMHAHPLALLRTQLGQFKVVTAAQLRSYPNGRLARASGLVTHRQRPSTAKGTVFVTLEDETGAVNIIVWPNLVETFRKELLNAQLMTIYGVWQRSEHNGGQVTHLLAKRIVDHTEMLGRLQTASRDFH